MNFSDVFTEDTRGRLELSEDVITTYGTATRYVKNYMASRVEYERMYHLANKVVAEVEDWSRRVFEEANRPKINRMNLE